MIHAQRIPAPLIQSAAERLVSVPARSRRVAARQLIESAPAHGIDLSLVWGTIDDSGPLPRVSQACLIVPTPGRTAMIYVSGPDDGPRAPDPSTQHAHRVATLGAAFDAIRESMTDRVALAQALIAPVEHWAHQACLDAGMRQIAELSYQKLVIPSERLPNPPLPHGVELLPAGDVTQPGPRAALARALERSYIDTQDCPELCGLREVDDVIDSHRATGRHDPALWWVVSLRGQPEGALLLSPFPEQASVELVYLGVGPVLRGKGLGQVLMEHAIDAAANAGALEMTCAVDMNNPRALRLYKRLGFRSIDRRLALVRSFREPDF